MDCPHGFPSRKSCVDCMMDGPVEEPKTIRRNLHPARTMQAGYPGRCANCDARIDEGDTIGIVETVGWCCHVCLDL